MLLFSGLMVFACAANSQEAEFRTYQMDSSIHYFLGAMDTHAGLPQVMPNPLAGVDLQALSEHPMVKDPLEIVDFPEHLNQPPRLLIRPEYDFLKPGKYRNDLNFNLKFSQ